MRSKPLDVGRSERIRCAGCTLGVDSAARPLEIVTVEEDDGAEVVIHAMELRQKYHPRGGRP